ncbi:MAG TPA: hypothetical protein VFY29_09020, partial [Terriglobia bacterium]|nr:hypothetical protein [Terriglobia bacterium]
MTQIKARRLIMGGGLLACVLALAVSAFLEAQPLPDRLSDAEFWKMVSDFSEPGGSFRFENFLSNEIEYQRVIPFLVSAETPGGVYLGVGPEQNFTYLSALRPKMAFIIDIRRQNMVELMMYKALFEIAEDRADFVSRLFSRKRPAGLNARSTADELFRAYRAAPADKEL